MSKPDTNEKKSPLREQLTHKTANVWSKATAAERKQIMEFGKEYSAFLDAAKTEREAVKEIVEVASRTGFSDLTGEGTGGRYFHNYKGKVASLFVNGSAPISAGLHIIVAHIDAPRLDLKQNPLYEDSGLAMLKTHYYGGIKKYQWVSRPLAMHGVVVLPDGKSIEICLGEDPADPVFTIADLLPHLWGKTQATKKAPEIITGEQLNLVTGSLPWDEDEDDTDSIKMHVLQLLHEKYGIAESDFISAEIEIVPACKARDVGLDRGLIGAYGHDDRVCSWSALQAALQVENPVKTTCVLLMDKEEIGSETDTGSASRYIETALRLYLAKEGLNDNPLDVLAVSNCLSADVNAAINPNWKSVHDKQNACLLGHGPVLTKFTGSRGKGGSNDAHAEFLGWLRGMLQAAGIRYQTAELGKVDEGGGGTVALFFARYGMNVVDLGVGLIGMHSPFEVAAKSDIWMAWRAYKAFLEA
ncbi:MAG: aminopeptidase [Candidatus Delongbacteria bacterium]|nr:aminopeptidase [bacterium]MBL7033168.1 aminopeptidase [Candidatus Delongbacteria bacterium]